MRKIILGFLIMFWGATSCIGQTAGGFKPSMDWGHWRLGQKSDLEFLKKNNMTVTFGSGAPNFETVSREEFDRKMAEAKAFNQKYHDLGYIVLRYLSTSLNGATATANDTPQKDQINLLKFYNTLWEDYSDYIGPKPPQQEDPTNWIMVQADGQFPFYRYAPYGEEKKPGFEFWGCPNNPYYVRMMEGRVRAQAEAGIDGSYVDWTHIAGGTCYCKYTHSSFIQYLKETLPAAVAQNKYGVSDYDAVQLPQKRGEKFWMEWLKFRGYSVAAFHKRLLTAARGVNPNFQIAGNVYGGFGYGPIAYDAAGNFDLLGVEDTFLYSEIQEYLDSAPRKNEQGVKITNSPALKYLSAASHGKPVIVYATEITPPIFPNPTDQVLGAMAQINIAEAVANHAIFREKRLTPQGATDMYAFLAANESYLLGAQLCSNVAILTSLNQYLADELSFAFTSSRIFADHGIAHDLIMESDLVAEQIRKYDLVLVPYLPLLSIKAQAALEQYIQGGGIVLLLGRCGQKDENNVVSDQNIFLRMLKQQQWPTETVTQKIGKGKLVYLPLEIPADKFLVQMNAKADATTFGPTMADLFADIPEAYTRGRINPRAKKVLTDVAQKLTDLLAGQLTQVKSDSPYLEITTMLQTDKKHVLVHLVNYDVTIDGVITPAKNPVVQLVLPKGVHATQVLYSGNLAVLQPVAFQADQAQPQVITFTAPEVQVYGLALVELAKN
jgi:hypothetical protein